MAKSGQKEAKFFCQCCGSEVPRKSRFCPKCGKFFASVLCPNCGHTGQTQDFISGCPQCGYAVNGQGAKPGAEAEATGKKTKNIKIRKNRMYLPLGKNGAKSSGDYGLPLWIYAVSILVLFGLVGVLYSCL